METIQREQCKKYHLYNGMGRNFGIAVCLSVENGQFMGRRVKSDDELVFEETHSDFTHGTYRPKRDLGPLSLEAVAMIDEYHKARTQALEKFNVLNEAHKDSKLTRQERELTEEFDEYTKAKTNEGDCEQVVLDWLLDIETQWAKVQQQCASPVPRSYQVTWSIDIEASCPEEAAYLARDIQLTQSSIATVFNVSDTGSSCFDVQVDLLDMEVRPYRIGFSNSKLCKTIIFARSFESARILGEAIGSVDGLTVDDAWLVGNGIPYEYVKTVE